MKRIVVALGGNLILEAGHTATFEEQVNDIELRSRGIAYLVMQGHQVVVVHGNGPQVGASLIQNEEAAAVVPAMPLHNCVAQTQGQLGTMLQLSLTNALRAVQIDRPVVTLVTHTIVSQDDPALTAPTKAIGPYYAEQRARRLMREHRFHLKKVGNRGWRRLVPSPDPKKILEGAAIERLLEGGAVVIAAGGGGVPLMEVAGTYKGIDAVIEKDLAAQQLAHQIDADLLLHLTDVQGVALDFGKPQQRWLDRVTAPELRHYQQEGHFGPESMGPKVESAVRFVSHGQPNRRAVIGSLSDVPRLLAGHAGTWVVPL